MALSQEMQVAVHRLVLFCLGGLAALALWGLSENWDNPALRPALYLALFTFVAVYSTVALALAGPVSTKRALGGALVIAWPLTALVSVAGLRFELSSDLLDEPLMLSVALVLVFVSLPFLQVWLQDRSKWRRYSALFDAAWTMLVRYLMAWVFVAVFWLVVVLSNALLQLVGVDVIDAILSTDWSRFGLSGAVLGLGLAVVYELRTTISPYLILRLLRLLVPVILVVVVVFLAALPLRGLSELFGEFSAATTLMGVAIVVITLVSSALDREDARAVSTRGLRLATRGLAVVLPVLTVLAVWAVILRVQQYGWTPDRVLAATAALIVLAYGLGYSAAAVRRTGWADRARRVNVIMALAIIVISALWMTPVLNPYRISANSQIGRFEAGRATLDQLPIWQLQHDWGRTGQSGLDRLASMTDRADHAELLTRIEAAQSATSVYRYQQAIEEQVTPDNAASLANLMTVRPAGPALTAADFAELPYYTMNEWLKGCDRRLPDGRPGCVLVRGTFSPIDQSGAQGMVLYLGPQDQTRVSFVLFEDGQDITVKDVFDPVSDSWPRLPVAVVAQALDGDFEIRPSGTNALFIGDAVLVPEN